MRKLTATFAAAAMAFTVVAAGPAAQQAPDGYAAEYEVKSGETVTHEGVEADFGTTVIFDSTPECGASNEDKCDKVLVKTLSSGEASFFLDASYDPADFDVTVYESDADGSIGDEVASSGNFYFPVDESEGFGLAPFEAATWTAKKGKYYAVVVYYFMAGGGYTLDVSMA